MKKILFLLLFLSVTMQAGYVIQLGLYKNRQALEEMVDHIAKSKLRSNVIIEKRGDLHWAHSRTIEDKATAQQSLLQYRKVFKDAFIKEIPTTKVKPRPISKEKQKSKIVNTAVSHTSHAINAKKEVLKQSEAVPSKLTEQNHETSKKKLSLEKRLKGNVFYVCVEAAKTELLIVAFDENHVEYNTVIGDIPSFKEQYAVINDRLYVFKDKASKNSVYSTLEEVKGKYLLISNWNQNEKVNTLRYYYNLEDALAYVQGD